MKHFIFKFIVVGLLPFCAYSMNIPNGRKGQQKITSPYVYRILRDRSARSESYKNRQQEQLQESFPEFYSDEGHNERQNEGRLATLRKIAEQFADCRDALKQEETAFKKELMELEKKHLANNKKLIKKASLRKKYFRNFDLYKRYNPVIEKLLKQDDADLEKFKISKKEIRVFRDKLENIKRAHAEEIIEKVFYRSLDGNLDMIRTTLRERDGINKKSRS
jgi:hypothetical protein